MFQDLNFSSSQKDLKQSYYSSFFKDSSYNANENFLLKSKTKEVLTPLMFLKCPKHPMFDLILVCTEKKCNYSPVICKVCLTDTHLDHKYMNLTDFFHVTKEKIKKNEYIKEQKFLKIKSNIDQIIENLCLEYGEIIKTMKDFIENVQAKMKTDFNFFWKSLQEYPPFKFSTIIRRIENNSINTVRVLNSSLNFLLDYDNEKKAKINQELETEIEENFTSILQNMKYNQEKLKKTKEKVEEVLNSILLDKISTFHSNYAPKNDSMLRNEGISESRLTEDIFKPLRDETKYDDELTKFTQRSTKKVKFTDLNVTNNSFLMKKLPLLELSENKKFWNVKTFNLHKGPIFNFAYLSDITSFTSVSADHTIKIYDLRSDKLTTTLYSHSGPVNNVLYLRKNDIFITSSADTSIKIWSSKTFMLIKSIDAHEIWTQPLISLYDENILVSGGGDEKIKLWDISTGKCLNVYEHHRKGVNALTELDDKSSFISHGFDNCMTLWDCRRNKPVITYKNDGDFFNKIIYLSEGDILIAASQDGTIKAFMKQNLMNYLMKKAHLGSCNALEYFYDGKTFASGGEDGMIKIWNSKTLEVLESFEGHKEAVQCLLYLNNSKSFLSGSVDKSVKLWEVI